MTPPKSLKILCFGDSLTAGYHHFGLHFTPYSTRMLSVLSQNFKEKSLDYKVEVTTDGASGELVTGPSFKGRMESHFPPNSKDLKNERKGKGKGKGEGKGYDFVVFLGGTNDLGWGKSVDEIWEALVGVTGIALGNGAKVLICTVPECRVRSERLDGKRDAVNDLIRGDGREGVYVFDLHKHVPYHSMDEEERHGIWDDGLHFSGKGYERIGEMVAGRLVEIIENELVGEMEGL